MYPPLADLDFGNCSKTLIQIFQNWLQLEQIAQTGFYRSARTFSGPFSLQVQQTIITLQDGNYYDMG